MNVHTSQEVCPWNVRFAEVASERDYAARKAWEAEWGRDDPAEGVSAETSPDDEGPTEAVIPTTDGPALVDLMKMDEEEWDAFTRGSATRRAGYAGLRRCRMTIPSWRKRRRGRLGG